MHLGLSELQSGPVQLLLRCFAAIATITTITALVGCSSGGTTVTGGGTGEGSGTERSDRGGETSGEGASSNGGAVSSGSPGPGGSSGEWSSSGGSSSGSSSSGSSGGSSSGSSSGGSGSGGSTAPHPECVAWANRHCSCLESVNAAAPSCRTNSAKGCTDGIELCPAQLSWYQCSQTTCGKSCPDPGC